MPTFDFFYDPVPFQYRVDPMTGLTTHRVWMKRTDQLGRLVAYVDIDQLKTVNDFHSLHAGDAVVRGLANRLDVYRRQHEHLYRLGGDEFLLVHSRNLPVEAARARSKALRQLWLEPFAFEGTGIQITAGIVVTIVDDLNLETFWEKLRDLMLQNKKQGRNQLLFA
ncbi:GGDEF domain-containing protein [Deinococcus roseus]|uniref:GGDEF domain-containing protein n=1 Tax=Deinococcus roseus TaxID=392414 RepID=A0ABQ2D0I8_9DEIO|nr:GGDEF domain-containing protein [Deinococcus roseus]GGJ37606.1 hypothetical protein GCM10008938_24680 [Deinococcus roseus]